MLPRINERVPPMKTLNNERGSVLAFITLVIMLLMIMVGMVMIGASASRLHSLF